MVESYKPYLAIIRDSLTYALCLRNLPSQIYEKINRQQGDHQIRRGKSRNRKFN